MLLKRIVIFFMVSLVGLLAFSNNVTDKIQNATVRIFFFTQFEDVYGNQVEQMSQGTGTIISEERILSAHHLGTKKPQGTFHGFVPYFKEGRKHVKKVPLSVEKYNIEEDLVVFKMEGLEGVVIAPVAEDYPEIGELMFFAGFNAMGMPVIRPCLFTRGYKEGAFYYPIFFGDSGGGAFNKKGELIGVTKVMYVLNGVDYTLVGKAARLEAIQELLK